MAFPTPYSKQAVDDIVAAQNLKDVTIVVESGSSKGDNYVGEITRIKVKGVDLEGKEEMLSLIMKMAPREVKHRQKIPFAKFFGREVFAYTKMLPVLSGIQEEYKLPKEDRFHYAKLYKSLLPETGEMLIFEDLCVLGFKMYDRTIPFNYDHLSFTIKNIARYHATSFVLKVKNPELFGELAAHTCDGMDLGEAFEFFVDKCIKKLLDVLDIPSEKDYLINYFQNQLESDIQRIVNSDRSAPHNVLCHGDCWSNNFLYAYKDGKVSDKRMLDWQFIRCAPPIADLSFAMFTSMDEDMRSKHYSEMLDLYYNTLSNNISKMGFNPSDLYPEPIFRDQVRTTMRYGLIMAIPIMPLTLADKDNVPDLDIFFDKEKSANLEMIFSETCTKRMKSLVTFCIKENII